MFYSASERCSCIVESYILDSSFVKLPFCLCFVYVFVKLRERKGQRVDLGRSLKGHLWMVDGGWWISFP